MVAVKLERGCRLQSGGSIPDCLPVVGPSAAGRRQEWHASAGNRAQVTSMATMYSATRPLMPLQHFELDELLSTSSPPGGAWRQPLAVHRFGR